MRDPCVGETEADRAPAGLVETPGGNGGAALSPGALALPLADGGRERTLIGGLRGPAAPADGGRTAAGSPPAEVGRRPADVGRISADGGRGASGSVDGGRGGGGASVDSGPAGGGAAWESVLSDCCGAGSGAGDCPRGGGGAGTSGGSSPMNAFFGGPRGLGSMKEPFALPGRGGAGAFLPSSSPPAHDSDSGRQSCWREYGALARALEASCSSLRRAVCACCGLFFELRWL